MSTRASVAGGRQILTKLKHKLHVTFSTSGSACLLVQPLELVRSPENKNQPSKESLALQDRTRA